ncbi:MAG: transporter substrate-binding domain-containing protein [Candidatus Thermoplasmatota archaeon]|nr:transporter substrate-binding domain-containing protein [Candidatus Thermoplasmatota archaeon]
MRSSRLFATQRAWMLTLLLLATALSGCTAPEGDGGGPGTLTIGTEAAYAPFEDRAPDGTIRGFDIDVMREITNRTGHEVTFQDMQFNAIIPSIKNGQLDAGISAFTITDERKREVAFTVPYYDNELLVATAAGNDEIQEPADLEGERVCTQQGTTAEQWLRRNVDADNETLMLLNSFPPCAEAVKRGDAAAMMIDKAAVRSLIAESGGDLQEAFTVSTGEQFGIAVAKENSELLSAFNTALQAMKQDGTMETLEDKWQV